MNRRLAAALALALALALAAGLTAGCSAPKQPTDKPGIVGVVESLTPYGNDGVSFLVTTDTQKAEAAKYVSDKAMVNVDSTTVIVDASGKKVDAKGIAAGEQVTVWFNGGVAESYPVQGTASYIRIDAK